MSHIHTDDETWAWGGTPENAIQEMLKPENEVKRKQTIMTIRSNFLKLATQLKRFGETKCKFHKNRKGRKKSMIDCFHPSMNYGGIDRNTDCEIENCPRVLYGNEG